MGGGPAVEGAGGCVASPLLALVEVVVVLVVPAGSVGRDEGGCCLMEVSVESVGGGASSCSSCVYVCVCV